MEPFAVRLLVSLDEYSQEFTKTDRRALVESLLQRDDVLAHIFDMFFPAALASTVARGQPTSAVRGRDAQAT